MATFYLCSNCIFLLHFMYFDEDGHPSVDIFPLTINCICLFSLYYFLQNLSEIRNFILKFRF